MRPHCEQDATSAQVCLAWEVELQEAYHYVFYLPLV